MKEVKIGIVGLGYVGLPLACAFGKQYSTVGFDINLTRIKELSESCDVTREVDELVLKEVIRSNSIELEAHGKGLFLTSSVGDLTDCNVYIVTVPTPTDKNNRPDLTPLKAASSTVGKVLSVGDCVVYESTVYPGVTEDECVPVLESISGLKLNNDFVVGYSPERINPGDKERTLENILKVTSGSNEEAAEFVDMLYSSIIKAGTYKASSIKVAEASKVIENSQRDVNIAFVNELAQIFGKLGINTYDVLDAAGTKWNFLNFKPGLVGGHCIGVDPHYLATKAEELGYYPELIRAGRRINDSMGEYITRKILNQMVQRDMQIKNANVIILGITFKENCPDIRNTRVIDVYKNLKEFGINVDVYDPWVDICEVEKHYGIKVFSTIPKKTYDVIFVAVAHSQFRTLDLSVLRKGKSILFDLKNFLSDRYLDVITL